MAITKPTLLARCSAAGIAAYATLATVLSAQAVPQGKKPVPQGKTPALTGEQIYAQRCASCHGATGEGSKAYGKPLAGKQSVGQLATFIGKAMPPGAAKKPSAAEAQKIAAYVHESFYSPVAQARNKPPRVELSRLTVRQYRSAVADLVGSFRPALRADERHGLRGEYFKSRRFQNNERLLERVDPEIRFDWGQSAAVPEQADPHTFSIRWEGSVVAPETGDYEFIVRTEHGFRLWLNDPRTPLIDAAVKSGNDTEFRGSRFLLAGRAYPVRLEFSKATRGVDDTDKLKTRPVAKASLSLEWRLPKRVPEVIPQRCLIPVVAPETFVVTSPFPPDDRSMGYERGTSVSKEWDEATTEGALQTAAYVIARLRELSGAQDGAADRDAKLREFCRQFAARAFRRPLSEDLAQAYVEKQFQKAPDAETAVKRCVLMALKSPRFLFREAGSGRPDAYDVAARLSFGLWDSLPDAELLKAAAAGELSTREQVARQAERMAADPRAWTKLREFFLQWLKVDQYPDLAKDAKKFPGFDQAAASDLRTSFELTLEQTVWSERSDFRELFLSDKVFLNGRLAKFYGVNLPENAPFQPVSLDPAERAGVLTHPYLLASFAYLDSTSPIHRGVLIARNLLGRLLQPPPQAFAPIPADLHPNLTTRQRVMLQTQPAACASCHNMINPLGFTLEKFDAIGRFRTAENGRPVDATGAYQGRDGKLVKFAGVRDLANYLAGSEEARAAFVEKLFQNLVKQPVRAFGLQALPDLERRFEANGFNIRKQMVESMAASVLAGGGSGAGPSVAQTLNPPASSSPTPGVGKTR